MGEFGDIISPMVLKIICSLSDMQNVTISVVNVYFVVDSVHPTRRSARYTNFATLAQK